MAYIDNNEGESLKIVLEISFKNTSFFPFRLIGDKANGVFVTCLNDERSFLKNGDIFLYCENVKLSGLSCNQVYSVIKFFSLKNDGIINIIIWRNNSKNFESCMKRHWTVNEGLNLVNTQFTTKQSYYHYNNKNDDKEKEDVGEELLIMMKDINNKKNNNNYDDEMLFNNNFLFYQKSNSNNTINNILENDNNIINKMFTKNEQLKIHSYVVVFDEAKCKTTTLLQSKK